MAHCTWQGVGPYTCVHCGSERQRKVIRECDADRRILVRVQQGNAHPLAADCPHLLGGCDPPQETLVFGCGCASSKAAGVPVSVCECDLHGRCVTFTRGTHLADATIQRCVACPTRPK